MGVLGEGGGGVRGGFKGWNRGMVAVQGGSTGLGHYLWVMFTVVLFPLF